MVSQKPILAQDIPKSSPRPILGNVEPPKKFIFSFKFFKQVDHFGLSGLQSSWFISFLERLKEMSNIEIQQLEVDRSVASGVRYHSVDWSAKNIPIARSDLDWVDSNYIDNDEDFPILQFHISKALGRVHGFFDENNIFNIVLLDAKHNLQPSSYNGYSLIPTKIGDCYYTRLINKCESFLSCCDSETCSKAKRLQHTLQDDLANQVSGAFLLNVSQDTLNEASGLKDEGVIKSFEEVFKAGIEKIIDDFCSD